MENRSIILSKPLKNESSISINCPGSSSSVFLVKPTKSENKIEADEKYSPSIFPEFEGFS